MAARQDSVESKVLPQGTAQEPGKGLVVFGFGRESGWLRLQMEILIEEEVMSSLGSRAPRSVFGAGQVVSATAAGAQSQVQVLPLHRLCALGPSAFPLRLCPSAICKMG